MLQQCSHWFLLLKMKLTSQQQQPNSYFVSLTSSFVCLRKLKEKLLPAIELIECSIVFIAHTQRHVKREIYFSTGMQSSISQGTQQLNQAPRSIESFNPYNWQRLNRAWWMGGFCSIFASVNGRAGSNDQLLPWRSVVVCYNEPSDLPQSHNNCVVVLMWMTCNLVNTKWASHRMICVRTICSKIIVRFFLPAVHLVRVLVARTANAK